MVSGPFDADAMRRRQRLDQVAGLHRGPMVEAHPFVEGEVLAHLAHGEHAARRRSKPAADPRVAERPVRGRHIHFGAIAESVQASGHAEPGQPQAIAAMRRCAAIVVVEAGEVVVDAPGGPDGILRGTRRGREPCDDQRNDQQDGCRRRASRDEVTHCRPSQ